MPLFQALFGAPKKTPDEMAKEWRSKLQQEGRGIDRQMRNIQREELKVKTAARQAAKKGDTGAVRLLAKELIHSRKAVQRLHTAKTQMSSVGMQLQLQQSQLKMAGTLQRSTQIMAMMNNLCRVTEVGAVMRSLSQEMSKAGIMEEMMGEALDDAFDDVDESELDTEVNKVVDEIMQSTLAGAKVGTSELPIAEAEPEQEPVEAEPEEDEDEELAKRFASLRQ
jgi:charged multivesicular body protein 3